MKNAIRVSSIGAVLALACSGAFALEQDLGLLTTADTTFGNTFYASTLSFKDYYTFSLGISGTVSGTTTDGSKASAVLLFDKDVVLTSLTLVNQTSGLVSGYDLSIPTNGTTNTFSFASLAEGSYKLSVAGYVIAGNSASANYTGTIRTSVNAGLPSASVASPAPEPADLALTVMGLAGVGLMLRRSRKAA